MKKNQTDHGFKWPCGKLFLVMRLSIFLFFAFIFTVNAESYSQTTKLNLELGQTKLTDVLSEIENRSEFYFYYNLNLDSYNIQSVKFKDKTINEVLDLLLGNLNLTYEIVDRYVVIKKADEVGLNSGVQSSKQEKTVTGRVTDPGDQQLPEVPVMIKRTNKETIT